MKRRIDPYWTAIMTYDYKAMAELEREKRITRMMTDMQEKEEALRRFQDLRKKQEG